MAFKEAWRGKKLDTKNYPVVGVQTTGQQKVAFDLTKYGVKDSLAGLLVHLTGNVVIAAGGGAAGTATGAYNPEGLLTLATLQTSPQINSLVQVNSVSNRMLVIDRAIRQKAFQLGTNIPNTVGTQPVDVWYYLNFKRDDADKGHEYSFPMNRWTSAILNLVLGTEDQLYSGATQTWDMTGVTVELWADEDVDVFNSGGPKNIHASEFFEQVFAITASNPAFDINTLPQGVFYDELVFTTEEAGVLTDGIITNINVNSGSRIWTLQGDGNAEFIRDQYTRPLFADPTTQNSLRGIYILPLRDGRWSAAMDAVKDQLDIKLAITYPGSPTTIRVMGRKLVPFGIRAYDAKTKTVTEKIPIQK